MKTIKDIYEYREMIVNLVRQDLRSRYQGSVLGFLWTFLNPLLQLMIYTLVFSNIMRSGIEHYAIFLFVALIPWMFFSSSVSGGASCIIERKDLIKKIYFPRRILCISYVTGAFVNMLFSFLVVFAVLFVSGYGISFELLVYLPFIMLTQYLLALCIVLICSSAAVYLRDLQYILGIVCMVWMYLTPVMYAEEMVPEKYMSLFSLNPMTPLIGGYRCVLYEKMPPDLSAIGSIFLLDIVLLLVGNVIFGKLEKHFAEEL